jgi:hypothetical protein
VTGFTAALRGFWHEDGRHFEVTEEFIFRIGGRSSPYVVRVPAGFVTDLASTPRPIWWIYPPFGRYLKAAVLHDYLCSVLGLEKRLVDAVFFTAMAASKCPWWERFPIFWAVRLFGWTVYKPTKQLWVDDVEP